jgi:hypothetical protein
MVARHRMNEFEAVSFERVEGKSINRLFVRVKECANIPDVGSAGECIKLDAERFDDCLR